MCKLFFVAGCSAKGGNAAISTSSRLETFGVAPPLSRRFPDPKQGSQLPMDPFRCPNSLQQHPYASEEERGGVPAGPRGIPRGRPGAPRAAKDTELSDRKLPETPPSDKRRQKHTKIAFKTENVDFLKHMRFPKANYTFFMTASTKNHSKCQSGGTFEPSCSNSAA